MAKRYQPQALLSEQDGVQTFSGRDALTGLPVLLYSFMGEPTTKPGELTSPHIPPVLEVTHVGGAGEVVTALSPDFQTLRGTVPSQQVEALLRHTAAALDDAARAGVVHGDLSPARVRFDGEAGGRFVLEGYGVPWRVRPSEFSPPERISGATFAGDLFSWAMTVRHLSGPLPGDLRDLLSRCLDADPQARPHAREVRATLESYAFAPSFTSSRPQAARDVSAFERFATRESEVEQSQADEDDLTPPETSGWHIPLPPVITDRVSSVPKEGEAPSEVSSSTENEPAPRPSETPAPPTAISRSASRATRTEARLEPMPKPIVQETGLPPESLRRTDGTLAYEARRKQYQESQGGGVQASLRQGSERTRPPRTSTESTVQTSLPVNDPPSATDLPIPEVTATTSEAQAIPAVQDVPMPGNRGWRTRRTQQDTASSTGLEPVPAPELDEDFEVVDDIDDHAPDPTLSGGGLRVLLSTLLVIAIVVLIALQFI